MNKSILTKSIIAIFVLIIMYLFALNGRYMRIEDSPYIFDKWKNSLVDITKISTLK